MKEGPRACASNKEVRVLLETFNRSCYCPSRVARSRQRREKIAISRRSIESDLEKTRLSGSSDFADADAPVDTAIIHIPRNQGPQEPGWMTQQLEIIFKELGVAQYLDTFVDQGFDTWETILDITESDL